MPLISPLGPPDQKPIENSKLEWNDDFKNTNFINKIMIILKATLTMDFSDIVKDTADFSPLLDRVTTNSPRKFIITREGNLDSSPKTVNLIVPANATIESIKILVANSQSVPMKNIILKVNQESSQSLNINPVGTGPIQVIIKNNTDS